MKKEDLRIVFMGTPEFAVASLRRLVEDEYHVVGVVTMPDKPKGRHQDTLQPSAVKIYAESVGLPVLQPEKLRDEAFLAQLRALRADLQIVVAFRMLPEVVWAMPRLGTFNLHASLLPQYRGAAPINWALINGERETGVTTFFLSHDIDTGDVIAQKHLPITDDDNAGTVHDKLMALGADLVIETVNGILQDNLKCQPQSEMQAEELKPAPKIFKDTCRIDWTRGTTPVFNFVRGLSPYPAAWTELTDGRKTTQLKIFSTSPQMVPSILPVGTLEVANPNRLLVHLPDGALQINELQLAGKKRMKADDFIRGFRDLAAYHVE